MRFAFAATLILSLSTFAEAAPQTVVIDGSRLETQRAKLNDGSASDAAKQALAALKRDADSWLNQGPWSVVDKGKAGANTSSIHDYYSLAPYYWAGPKTASNPLGCPWVSKDGQHNPEVDKGTDRQAIGKVAYSVPSLALAWYYTGNQAYATHAADIVRTWFINPNTMMNPNLQHGQVITCENTGRSIGIIDFSQMYTSVLDAVAILNSGPAPGWTAADIDGFKHWNEQYYDWLTNSDFGKEETAQTNNHGTFADMQRAAIALYLGQGDTAKNIVESTKANRIDKQLSWNGAQLLEIARTRSFHYCAFNLVAMTRLAQIGEKIGVDLWHYKGPQQQQIFEAITYMIPSATGAQWLHPEMNFTQFSPLDVIHAASDAGLPIANAAVTSGQLKAPPKGDLWYIRPAAEQLDSVAG